MKLIRFDIVHDPDRTSVFPEDMWEFLGENDLIVDEQTDRARNGLHARTVVWHKPMTPELWELFNEQYGYKESG